jgi:hypothetical protein
LMTVSSEVVTKPSRKTPSILTAISSIQVAFQSPISYQALNAYTPRGMQHKQNHQHKATDLDPAAKMDHSQSSAPFFQTYT